MISFTLIHQGDDNSYYDMLLNMERITPSAAVAGIANSAGEMMVQ